MKIKKCRYRQLFFLIMIAMLTLAGCNARTISNTGAAISHENHMILLHEGDQQGIWKTNELALNYHYLMTPETLKLSGTVNLVGGFAIGFSLINRLVVQLVFLDNKENVIDSVIVYSAGNRRPIDMTPMIFDKTIPVPSGTLAISFAYDGELTDGGKGSTSVNIWNSPF